MRKFIEVSVLVATGMFAAVGCVGTRSDGVSAQAIDPEFSSGFPGSSGSSWSSADAAPAPEAAPPVPADRHFPVVSIPGKQPAVSAADPRAGSPAPGLPVSTPETGPDPLGGEGPMVPGLTPVAANGGERPQPRAYRLRPLDQIIVNFMEPVRENIETLIDENGFITLRYVDKIQAAGSTATELEDTIRRAYLDGGIYNRITLNVIIPLRFYTIQGEVNRPGRYPIYGSVTLIEVLAESGNFTDWANKREVEIQREGVIIEVDYNDAVSDPAKNVPILPNDVIRIKKRIF